MVCFEYPRRGIWSLGFVTNRAPAKIHDQRLEGDGKPRPMLNIFVPTSPNPTSGFFLMVPVDEVSYPPISVEEALNLVISGGVILPEHLAAETPSPIKKD